LNVTNTTLSFFQGTLSQLQEHVQKNAA